MTIYTRKKQFNAIVLIWKCYLELVLWREKDKELNKIADKNLLHKWKNK